MEEAGSHRLPHLLAHDQNPIHPKAAHLKDGRSPKQVEGAREQIEGAQGPRADPQAAAVGRAVEADSHVRADSPPEVVAHAGYAQIDRGVEEHLGGVQDRAGEAAARVRHLQEEVLLPEEEGAAAKGRGQ